MLLFANCKINLGLDVIARRVDGYHDLETVMLPVRGLCDALEITHIDASDAEKAASIAPESGTASGTAQKSVSATLVTSGLAVGTHTENNLCMRAWCLMRERYGIDPVRIHLHKVVPTGAGLGGGSADATFTLCGLNTLFGLGLDSATLESLAAELGSDTSFFVQNRSALAAGRGEILTPYPVPQLDGKYLVVVKPDVTVSTRDAYAGVAPSVPQKTLAERLAEPIGNWRTTVGNAFEKSIFARYPQLAQIKRTLYNMGAMYVSMSGSGSAIYGIFAHQIDCSGFSADFFVYQEFIR